jgi:hypothetical protein
MKNHSLSALSNLEPRKMVSVCLLNMHQEMRDLTRESRRDYDHAFAYSADAFLNRTMITRARFSYDHEATAPLPSLL